MLTINNYKIIIYIVLAIRIGFLGRVSVSILEIDSIQLGFQFQL